MDLLRRALKNDRRVSLDAATFEMAQIEYPGLSPAPYLKQLDELAQSVAGRLPSGFDAPTFLRALVEVLSRETGLKGDEKDYQNPKNSCLNHVLESRLGIPITLSVVYMEVARRLGKNVFGVGLPGHFVVGYRDEKFEFFLDPFYSGRFITDYDCQQMALDYAAVDISQNSRALKPVSHRYILTRMLNNLLGAYSKIEDFHKLAAVLDLLIEAHPEDPAYYHSRATARIKIRKFRAASDDFQEYLRLAPDSPNREEVMKQLKFIQEWVRQLN